MTTLQEMLDRFCNERTDALNRRNSLSAEISTLEKKKEKYNQRIDKRLSKLEAAVKETYHDHYLWYDIVEDIARQLKDYAGVDSYRLMGPFGITCEYSIWLYNQKDKDASDMLSNLDYIKYSLNGLNFHIVDDSFSVTYHTGEVTNKFPKGSIGDLNGLNNVSAELPNTIEEIFNVMDKK